MCVRRRGAKVAEAIGPAGCAGLVVLSAFGGDAVGAVLSTSAAASRHHGGPVIAVVSRRVGFGCLHVTGR